ncbi:hypothetical protein [Mucilaginibacter sp.]|uniref:hypothetical protein n=1 Tax=Mucilaginibacter sp. TaxID=1882438 RepID=UPI0032677B4F
MTIENILQEIFAKKQQNIDVKLYSKYLPRTSNYFYLAFEYLLRSFFEINALTLRNLEQFSVYDLPIYSFKAGKQNYEYPANRYPFLVLFHLVKKLISISQIESLLVTLSNKYEIDNSSLDLLSRDAEEVQTYLKEISLEFMVSSLDYFNKASVHPQHKNKILAIGNRIVYYTLDRDGPNARYVQFREPTIEDPTQTKPIENNVFNFLLDALKKSENLVKIS